MVVCEDCTLKQLKELTKNKISLGMSGIQLRKEVYFSTRYKLAYCE